MGNDAAFENAAHIPDGESYPALWKDRAARFREGRLSSLDLPYGWRPREKLDLFFPDRLARGLVVFVHGGYWRRFDRKTWSHLAEGPLKQGWAVAIPSYDLAPENRISGITRQVVGAVKLAAWHVSGPVRLVGHANLIHRYSPGKNDIGLDSVYESWIVSQDSLQYPSVAISRSIPAYASVGEETSDGLAVTGLFFKLLTYRARDGRTRYAPLILAAEVTPPDPQRLSAAEISVVALAVLMGLSLAWHVARAMRRPRPRRRPIAAGLPASFSDNPDTAPDEPPSRVTESDV